MDITILYNAISNAATPDEQDVLTQVEVVRASLGRLGHSVDEIACTLNLESLARQLSLRRPDVVFNLVESLAGTDRLLPTIPALLEHLAIPCTGNPYASLCQTNDKVFCKHRLRQLGLPTPEWIDAGSESVPDLSSTSRSFIIKTIGEHASWGLSDDAVVHVNDAAELRQHLAR
ncbi:MAG: D-alanine--D-alanine ligase, partial [Planctomycetota bacterium]|nr:D-alanine--D-alanine ligase [Planctomycetota bacterium]MDA1213175.1 D-alanine--D-alanine ligase [Planctomycetota bacterium]